MSAGIKKSKNVDPLKIPNGIDSTTFFTPLIPEEIKLAMPLFHSCSVDIRKVLIQKMFEYLIVQDEFTLDQNSFGSDSNIDELNLLMTAIYIIIRTAVRNKVKISVIKADLTAMNVPKESVEDISTGVSKLRTKLEASAVENRIHFPKLAKLKWRIDVAISSGVLSRVMRPNILMQVGLRTTVCHTLHCLLFLNCQMILDDGSIRSFEVSVEQFNQLRYNVAKV